MQEFLLWPEPEDDISEEMIDRVAYKGRSKNVTV